jgi:hypothetical protein
MTMQPPTRKLDLADASDTRPERRVLIATRGALTCN